MYVGKKIKQLRQRLELTQEVFAQELQVSRPYYSSIESGKKEITLKMLATIKEKWGVPEYYFTTKDAELEDKLLGVSNGGINGGNSEISDDTNASKELDERDIVLIHREFSDTMSNLLNVCYLILEHKPDYFAEDDYKNLLLLDEFVLVKIFDVIKGKTTMRAYERKLRLYLKMASDLLHDYISDLRALSAGFEPGDQVVGSFKNLYETYKIDKELND